MAVVITKKPSQEITASVERATQASTCPAIAHSPKKKRGSGSAKPRKPLISLNEPGRLYTAHVLAVAGFSASHLFALIKSNRWPAPHKDSRRNYWHTHEVKMALGL